MLKENLNFAAMRAAMAALQSFFVPGKFGGRPQASHKMRNHCYYSAADRDRMTAQNRRQARAKNRAARRARKVNRWISSGKL